MLYRFLVSWISVINFFFNFFSWLDKAEQEALVAKLREKREELLTRRAARRQRKRDLAQRRTVAAQERMRLISQLARKDKKDDNFGMRDEDWDVYKTINKVVFPESTCLLSYLFFCDKDCGSSDSEEELEKLTALETELKANDPAFETGNGENMAPGESHQLHVATERIRAPEVLFQPSLVGSHEAGLAETLDFVLKRFTPEDQVRRKQDYRLKLLDKSVARRWPWEGG